MNRTLTCLLPLVVWIGAGLSTTIRADYVTLKNGGTIRGEFASETATSRSEVVTIHTLTGATVTVAHSDVASLVRRRVVLEEYELRRQQLADTLSAHWELAEWCRERLLKDRRATHLERVVEFDPTHEAAHRALGHIRVEGEWASRDEVMKSRGYVRYKGRFVLPQELELIRQEEQSNENEKAWYKRVRMWHGWLEGDRADRREMATSELNGITDPHAIPALARSFQNDSREQFRLLYVTILSRIDDNRTIIPLVLQSLQDVSERIRASSLQALSSKDLTKTIPLFVKVLRNDVNLLVNRAGEALGQLGDEAVVPRLIDALVTSHRYKTSVPDNSSTIGFRTDGGFAPVNTVPLTPEVANLMAFGQLPFGVQVNPVQMPGENMQRKTVIIKKNEQNPAVLQALQQLTGQNFGYNEAQWRRWLSQKKNGASSGTAAP